MNDAEAADYGRCIAALLAAGHELRVIDAREVHVCTRSSLGMATGRHVGTDPADAARKAALALGVQW